MPIAQLRRRRRSTRRRTSMRTRSLHPSTPSMALTPTAIQPTPTNHSAAAPKHTSTCTHPAVQAHMHSPSTSTNPDITTPRPSRTHRTLSVSTHTLRTAANTSPATRSSPRTGRTRRSSVQTTLRALWPCIQVGSAGDTLLMRCERMSECVCLGQRDF